MKERKRSFNLSNNLVSPPHIIQVTFVNHPPTLVFFIAETLMDSRWATTELAWTTFPESGVSSVCLCLFVFLCPAPSPCFLFRLLVNRAQSALNSPPPTVLYLCFCCVCFTFLDTKIPRSKLETHPVTFAGESEDFQYLEINRTLNKQMRRRADVQIYTKQVTTVCKDY